MVVTPKEAALLRCPPALRMGKGSRVKCVGPRCMWWQWIENVSRKEPEHGYCGGAGMPLTGAGI